MTKYTFNSGFATDFEHILPKSDRPTIVYLHGFCSDCWGKKPETVKKFCLDNGVGLFRFDYAGHGSDRENFAAADFEIWQNQVLEVIDTAVEGDVVCVGSSMGGWLALLAAVKRPERVKGVIGLAAAPNFVRRFAAAIPPEQQKELEEKGSFAFDTGDFAYVITRRFVDTAMAACLPEGKGSWPVFCPVHFIQGMEDKSLPWRCALDFAEAVSSSAVEVKLLKSSNHRLNDDDAARELVNSLTKIVNI